MRRRDALKLGLGACAAAAAATATLRLNVFGARRDQGAQPVARLSVAPIDIELAPGIHVRSIAFGGTVPGPPLTRDTGLATLEFHNESDSDTVVQSVALDQPLITIPARSRVQAQLRTRDEMSMDGGIKSYRAHCANNGAVASGSIFPSTKWVSGASAFDQLQVLSIHRWQPRAVIRAGTINETGVGYDYASFNDRLISASDPIKVRYGDRVHFHFSNTSASHGVTLGLPQHRFLVVALDGRNVPTRRQVERVYIGPAESVDALVTMDQPGRWVLGATHREDRAAGLGRLVEYAGAKGHPVENEYGIANWSYSMFGSAAATTARANTQLAAAVLSLQLVRRVASTHAQLRDPTPRTLPLKVSRGERYRLAATNLTRDPQSVQLLNHDVELVRIAGQRTAGVYKDVVTLPSFTRVEFEFEARTDDVFLVHNRQVSLEYTLPPAWQNS